MTDTYTDTLYRDRAPFTLGLRFTADVIEPETCDDPGDCTCTNVYGEPTEHGYGQTLCSGWCDPGWSPYVVDEDTGNRPDPETFTYLDPDEDEDPVVLIAERIGRWVCPDHVDVGPDRFTVYPADPIRDYRTGTESMLTAHVYGLSAAEAERLAGMLRS